MYRYLEFKLHFHKNLKLFSIRIKELFEPIVLHKKKKRRQVLKSIFLRNRSLSNARWFYGKKKKCKIGKGNLYLTENWLGWNEMCCAADNHNYMCHTCAKDILDSNSIKQLLTKYQIFTKLPQIPHFHNNCNFSSIFVIL